MEENSARLLFNVGGLRKVAYSAIANIAVCENIGNGIESTSLICSASPMLKRHNGQFLICCASRQHLHIAIYDSIFSFSLMA
jgi:hypothetical protein